MTKPRADAPDAGREETLAAAEAEVKGLRHRIDLLDEQLVRLLNARAACAVEIGRVKRRLGLEVYQPQREIEVLEHVRTTNHGPLGVDAMRRLFERIIDEARRLERLGTETEEADGS